MAALLATLGVPHRELTASGGFWASRGSCSLAQLCPLHSPSLGPAIRSQTVSPERYFVGLNVGPAWMPVSVQWKEQRKGGRELGSAEST